MLSLYRRLSNDVCVVSYPCSGRTWLRLMLGYVLKSSANMTVKNFWDLHLLPFTKGGENLPRIILSHDDNVFIKTPAELSSDRSHYIGRKVIFLARDPRDLIISWYFDQLKRGDLSGVATFKTFGGSLEEFIDIERGSLATIFAFYNSWMGDHQDASDFLLMRYEDLHRQPEYELRRCLSFCGYGDVSDEVIAEAVKYAAFDNVRSIEENNTLGWDDFRPGDKADKQSYKTRHGKIGDHMNQLAPEKCQMLDHAVKTQLDPKFGYDVAGGRNIS